MKKIIAVIIILILFLNAPISHAASGSTYLTGSATTHNGQFVLCEFAINGDGLDNVSGYINYSAEDLVIFSIEPNRNLSNWNITYDSNTPGKIHYSVGSSSTKLNSLTTFMTIKFIVHNEEAASTNITTNQGTTTVTSTRKVVANQDEIDEAIRQKENAFSEEIAETIVIPDPIYQDVEYQTTVSLSDANLNVEISPKVSQNTYLKTVEIPNATISPSFNKLTNNYRVTVDDKTEKIQLNAVSENPHATVSIGEETNGSIIVSVRSETDELNSYVFNIERRSNYSPDKSSVNPDPNPRQPDSSTLLFLAGMTGISLLMIMIGAYNVYKGSREYQG